MYFALTINQTEVIGTGSGRGGRQWIERIRRKYIGINNIRECINRGRRIDGSYNPINIYILLSICICMYIFFLQNSRLAFCLSVFYQSRHLRRSPHVESYSFLNANAMLDPITAKPWTLRIQAETQRHPIVIEPAPTLD